MGWILRKSFKLGPFRVNLSNSGISTSFGVKGARINFSKRGAYLNVGAGGIYYRQKLGMNTNNANQVSNSRTLSDDLQNAINKKPLIFWLGIIPSFVIIIALLIYLDHPVDANKTYSAWVAVSKNSVHIRETPSISGKIIKTVSRYDRFKFIERTENDWFKVSLSDSTAGFIKADLAFVEPKLASIEIIRPLQSWPKLRQGIIITSIVLIILYCLWIARLDKNRRTVELFYQPDDNLKDLHNKFLECFRELLGSKKIWITLSSETNYDTKYHGGANTLVSRQEIKSISDNQKPIKSFKTNIQVPSIQLNDLSLFFFPDQLIVLRQKSFASIPYKNLNVLSKDSKFVEEETVPLDASIVDYTWKHRNQNGDPDLRFSINPRLPICLYSEYNFQSVEGLNVVITTSKYLAMDRFASFINALSAYQGKLHSSR